MDTRITNLKALIERYDSQAEAARAMGIDPPALCRLLKGSQSLGNRRARAIEQELDLPEGWLDTDRRDHRDYWVTAYTSSLAGGHAPKDATVAADCMLEEIRSRFG